MFEVLRGRCIRCCQHCCSLRTIVIRQLGAGDCGEEGVRACCPPFALGMAGRGVRGGYDISWSDV